MLQRAKSFISRKKHESLDLSETGHLARNHLTTSNPAKTSHIYENTMLQRIDAMSRIEESQEHFKTVSRSARKLGGSLDGSLNATDYTPDFKYYTSVKTRPKRLSAEIKNDKNYRHSYTEYDVIRPRSITELEEYKLLELPPLPITNENNILPSQVKQYQSKPLPSLPTYNKNNPKPQFNEVRSIVTNRASVDMRTRKLPPVPVHSESYVFKPEQSPGKGREVKRTKSLNMKTRKLPPVPKDDKATNLPGGQLKRSKSFIERAKNLLKRSNAK